jgi:hypothetical protein
LQGEGPGKFRQLVGGKEERLILESRIAVFWEHEEFRVTFGAYTPYHSPNRFGE